MARNLSILAATLFFFSLVCFVMTFVDGSSQPGLPGNAALWRTGGLVLLLAALISAFAGVTAAMVAQVGRRNDERRQRGNRP